MRYEIKYSVDDCGWRIWEIDGDRIRGCGDWEKLEEGRAAPKPMVISDLAAFINTIREKKEKPWT